MNIGTEILEANTTKLADIFVKLPYKLYGKHRYWVPPMIADERKLLSPNHNPAFAFCDVRLWVAMQGKRCVGRIAAIINHKWIEKNGKRYGRISRFDSIDDESVAAALFAAAEDWLRSQGMEAAHGPLGFTNLDHQGVLIEGFDYLPSVGSEYSPSYYRRLVEACGYTKEQDWVEFRLTLPHALPQKAIDVAERIKQRYALRTITPRNKAELKEWAPRIFSLFNQAFSNLFGAYTFTPELAQFYIQKYMPVLAPRYVKLVVDANDNLVAFLIALPSMSAALQRARGRLLPLGWWHIARAYKRPQEIDLLLTGVTPSMQRFGVAALLMNELWATAHADGVRYVETTGMLEDNHVAIQMWKSFDHIQHKRKRCYIKSLI